MRARSASEHWSNAAANELSVQLMQRRMAARLEVSQAGADDTEPLDFIRAAKDCASLVVVAGSVRSLTRQQF